MGTETRNKQTFRSHPDVAWAVEESTVLVLSKAALQTIQLEYPEAALWDLISRSVPLHRIVPIISALLQTDCAQAEAWIHGFLAEWVDAELLVSETKNG